MDDPSAMSRVFAGLIISGQQMLTLLRETLYWTVKGGLKRRRPQILRQMYEIGNRSVLFITVTLGVLGMISVYQVLHQVEQILPDFSMIGPAFIQMMIREFGPTIAGLMIATRVGSGIAAEIGSMVVTEQVDALRMCNADPIDYLVCPRFVACTVQTVLLTIYACIIGVLAGSIVAMVFWDIMPTTFFNLQLVRWGDVVSGLMKAVCYGMAIPIIASHAGLLAEGGSEGVGAATTRAVVNASFAVVALDLILSAFSYLVLF
jgi:phospholipid/cholesterol/gamma-HCH transport system permease protein